MKKSRHELFLQELRAPVKRYLRNPQTQEPRKKKAGASPGNRGDSKTHGPSANRRVEELISMEKLLEEKFNELFGPIDDGE